MEPLLPNELRLFECIRSYLLTHRYAPSVRDLPKLLNDKSMLKVQRLMESLREKGYIDWEDKQPRTYRLLVGNMPMRGVIQAGYVVEQPVEVNDYIDVSGASYQPDDYALKVQGDSMIENHICEGDYVIIRPVSVPSTLKPGTIAAVWVDGEGATLKHLYQEDGFFLLKPGNRTYKTQIVEMGRAQVQGKLVGLHRVY